MIKLEALFTKIHLHLQELNNIRDPDLIDDTVKIENCIDVSDILIEYKVNLSSNTNCRLSL